MAVHKYIFYIDERGIRAYRAYGNNKFEVVRYMGEDICKESGLDDYFKWFDNVASIAPDDSVDFCFLSNVEITQPQLEYPSSTKSSWTKEDVIAFCQTMIAEKNYEISVGDGIQFVCHISNIYDKKSVEKFYLRCIPEFSLVEIKKQEESTSKDASVLYQYYRGRLNGL